MNQTYVDFMIRSCEAMENIRLQAEEKIDEVMQNNPTIPEEAREDLIKEEMEKMVEKLEVMASLENNGD